jgi:DNA-binding transcriptional MerR regulator
MVKARIQKRLYYKIGEACKALGIQPYVLRYWETEFPALAPSKSRSGQRVYSEKELEIIRRIKELLYDEGYTIAGAKKKLEAELASGSVGVEAGDEGTAAPAEAPATPATPATPAKPPRARKETAPAVVEAGAELSLPFALDTGAAERIQTLRSGIEQALQEAREILALLEPKSSP